MQSTVNKPRIAGGPACCDSVAQPASVRRLAHDMTRPGGRHRHRQDGKRNIALMAGTRPPDLKVGYEARRYLILRPPVRRALPDESLMSSISTIALSGLNAAARRLDVSASNVANAGSSGA